MKLPSSVPSISSRKLTQYFHRFSRARILVLGDLILDHYVWGKVHRVSPEAPVPVVHVDSESYRMGGAANVFHNIISLGGQAELCGVVGSDQVGKQFLTDIRRSSTFSSGVLIDASRPTVKKTRIVAHNQQIVRFDVEQRHDISTPKVEHMGYYEGVTVITPNHLEAKHAAGFLPTQDVPIEQIGASLLKRLGCQAVVVTRGEEGMSIFEGNGQSWTIPAVARQVYDVTGAGDTVVSTLALAISAKASLPDAAVLANQAAGIVVGMVGTATVTRAQLQEAFLHDRN
ncbi:MAG: PfkB family carbohydrate kinase [Nitrospirales bacterium]